MARDYLQKILTARVYDVAIESPLEVAPNLSARTKNTNAITLLGVHARSWSLFNEFLVAALAGAIALIEMNGVAVLVANGLHFKVPGVLQELLYVHAAVTKCSGSFLPGRFNSGA